MMTPIQKARQEWEAHTEPNPKNHAMGKKIHKHEFRKFGQAIAWLNWYDKKVEITKFEKIPGAGRRAGTPLIEFLKSLANKYRIRITGNAIVYDPDPPTPDGPMLTQDQLEDWYGNHGFQICKSAKTGLSIIWYPDAPQSASDACLPIETK